MIGFGRLRASIQRSLHRQDPFGLSTDDRPTTCAPQAPPVSVPGRVPANPCLHCKSTIISGAGADVFVLGGHCRWTPACTAQFLQQTQQTADAVSGRAHPCTPHAGDHASIFQSLSPAAAPVLKRKFSSRRVYVHAVLLIEILDAADLDVCVCV